MDEGLVEVEEDSFEVGVLAGELDVLASVGDFDAFAEAEHLYLLIEMLSVKVHHIAGLVLPEAAVELGHVVLLGSLALAQHFRLYH